MQSDDYCNTQYYRMTHLEHVPNTAPGISREYRSHNFDPSETKTLSFFNYRIKLSTTRNFYPVQGGAVLLSSQPLPPPAAGLYVLLQVQ